MKPFKSFLAGELEAFIQFRIDIGFNCKKQKIRYCLLPFDRFLVERQVDWEDLSPRFFLDFRQHMRTKGIAMTNHVFIFIRHFFDYQIRIGRMDENPVADIEPLPENAFIPFIFAPEQIDMLLAAAHRQIRKSEKYFYYDFGVYTAILLMAKCGLRISEPLRLRREHFRTDDLTLSIEKTKFNKDRLIPVPSSVVPALINYRSVIEASESNRNNIWFLAGFKGRNISTATIYKMFHKSIREINMDQKKQAIGNTTFAAPTPHSLRHSFAVNTLQQVKDRGGSAQNALPILSAYMGHTDYRYTAKYLKLVDAGHRQALVDFCVNHKDPL